MPKLWSETIEAHRRTVHDAILDTALALAAEQGPLTVTMSQIAERAGIGRATLYKYFPDVESILIAFHTREVAAHLEELARARDGARGPDRRLEAVLTAYALIHQQGARHHQHGRYGAELRAFLHRGEHVDHAQRQIHDMLRDLLADDARAGRVRDDVGPDELARYCQFALHAAAGLPSRAAVHRLVRVTLAGLRPAAC